MSNEWLSEIDSCCLCFVWPQVAVSVSTTMLGERGWSQCKVLGLRRCPSCWQLDLWRFRSGFFEFEERGGR